MNEDQTTCIFSTAEDALYIDFKKNLEIDIDEKLGISCIRTQCYYDNNYYILANKRRGIVGIYLAKI